MSTELNYYATNEKCEVQIVKPMQKILGNWILCRNREGKEWFVPFPELTVALESPSGTTKEKQP